MSDNVFCVLCKYKINTKIEIEIMMPIYNKETEAQRI